MFAMRPPVALLALAALGCAETTEPNDTPLPTEPGTETARANWDVDLYSAYESPVLASFDTRDGALVLEGMTLRIEHTAEAFVRLENASDVDLEAGDFVMDHYFNTLTQLGEATGTTTDNNGGPPFLGPGSFWIQVAEQPLGPMDSGTDVFEDTVTETITFEAEYDPVETPRYLEALTDAGDVTIVVGGFSETFFNFDPSLEGSGVQIDWEVPTFRYAGTIEVDYHFAPAANAD